MSQIRDGLNSSEFGDFLLGNYACVDIVLVGIYGANVLRTKELVEL